MKRFVLVICLFMLVCGISQVSAQSQGLEKGDKAPEITLANQRGETVALSSLKGRFVLIDFWATWCAPCINEQPELAKLYRKYKNSRFSNGKGFEIYGVSLDAKKEVWENGINKMKINWIQVSDLKFWKSPVAKTYNIQALPFNVLIYGNGIILAKNLHGIELENEIAKFLIK